MEKMPEPDETIENILIAGLFEFRRGLLAQVASLDRAIEKLTTLTDQRQELKRITPLESATIEDEGQD